MKLTKSVFNYSKNSFELFSHIFQAFEQKFFLKLKKINQKLDEKLRVNKPNLLHRPLFEMQQKSDGISTGLQWSERKAKIPVKDVIITEYYFWIFPPNNWCFFLFGFYPIPRVWKTSVSLSEKKMKTLADERKNKGYKGGSFNNHSLTQLQLNRQHE